MEDLSPEDAAHVARVMRAILAGVQGRVPDVCPHCQAAVTELQQIGRCVYAQPCGCRLYQGRLPKKEKAHA